MTADVLVHVQCAYTSLERWREFGLLDRERPWFERVGARFGRMVMVTYGGEGERALAESLVPEAMRGRVVCVCNTDVDEAARFQAGVPGRVLADLQTSGARTAVVWTDQHYGGQVGVAVARELRSAGVRVGLVARGGYHWSWFVARDHGADSQEAARAAVLEGELCHAADVVVGSTRRMVEDLAWRHGLNAVKARLIPNFVHVPERARGKRDTNLILAAGRLEPQKRFDLLTRAAGLVRRSRPGVRLRVYGDGSLKGELVRLAAEVGASVEFRPRIPQVQLLEEMGRCGVFAQTSMFEGHPKTIIEALACGSPVVVTRGSGVDEEIVPGETGVVTRDDPESIAVAIKGVLSDPIGARRIGDAAAADMRGRLSLDAIAPLVENACRDALALNGSGSTTPRGVVRWDQALLNAPPDAAAGEFAGAIGAYAKRLAEHEREAFTDALAGKVLPASTSSHS